MGVKKVQSKIMFSWPWDGDKMEKRFYQLAYAGKIWRKILKSWHRL